MNLKEKSHTCEVTIKRDNSIFSVLLAWFPLYDLLISCAKVTRLTRIGLLGYNDVSLTNYLFDWFAVEQAIDWWVLYLFYQIFSSLLIMMHWARTVCVKRAEWSSNDSFLQNRSSSCYQSSCCSKAHSKRIFIKKSAYSFSIFFFFPWQHAVSYKKQVTQSGKSVKRKSHALRILLLQKYWQQKLQSTKSDSSHYTVGSFQNNMQYMNGFS